jgi:hypothetical protein
MQYFITLVARAQSVDDIVQPMAHTLWQRFKENDLTSLLRAGLGEAYFAEPDVSC